MGRMWEKAKEGWPGRLVVTQFSLLCPIKDFFLSQWLIPLIKHLLGLINLIQIVIAIPKPSLR